MEQKTKQRRREISFRGAVNEALREEMRRDKSVLVIGEDVAVIGGVFGATGGLAELFGPKRVIDTPISEAGFIGACCTLAATGWKPVVELMFVDWFGVAMDQIYNHIAKLRWASAGKMKIPLVIRTTCGIGTNEAYQHSQCLQALFCHCPGLKVVVPSNAYDAKGLLKSSIRDDDPVIFFEHKELELSSAKEEVPEEEYTIPLGKASIKRKGNDVTLIATMLMVDRSLKAAEKLAKEGISVEVIDPRTLVPFDKETVIDSVKKTGRLVIVDEDYERCGMASQIAALVAEEGFDYLKGPIKRITQPNVPVPMSPPLIEYLIPTETKITEAIRKLVH